MYKMGDNRNGRGYGTVNYRQTILSEPYFNARSRAVQYGQSSRGNKNAGTENLFYENIGKLRGMLYGLTK